MGNRLTRIYTRTGDDGSTGLAGGARVGKDCPRIEAIGAVDELNSAIGWLAASELEPRLAGFLAAVQHDLFNLGGELAMQGMQLVEEDGAAWLERWIDQFNADLPPLRDFILPGGGEAPARCHLARAICRRCERRLVRLAQSEAVGAAALRYVNRLSDLLFVLARVLARPTGGSEILWSKVHPRPEPQGR